MSEAQYSASSDLTFKVDQQVNLIVHIAREAAWSQQHPEIMGPRNSYLYFGPSKTPGYLVYGNGSEVAMVNHLRHKKDASTYVLEMLCR